VKILCICWEIIANITENARSNTRKDVTKYLIPFISVLKELTVYRLLKKFLVFCVTRRFVSTLLKIPSPVPTLDLINPPCVLRSYLFVITINIVIPSTKRYAFLPPPPTKTFHTPRTDHSFLFDHPNTTWQHIMKLLIMEFSKSPVKFSLLRPNIFLNTLFWNIFFD
jgi:hypothetical protein